MTLPNLTPQGADVALDPMAGTLLQTGRVVYSPDYQTDKGSTPRVMQQNGPDSFARAQAKPGILALDPGTDKTGYCVLMEQDVMASGVLPNAEMLAYVQRGHFKVNGHHLAIEMIASYGMPVGREVFETCVWIGRFIQAWGGKAELVYRKDVKMHLCGTAKAKDGNVRQAILDLYPRTGGGATPQVGTKGQPGPLYGVSTHAWAALGVALTARHGMDQERKA